MFPKNHFAVMPTFFRNDAFDCDRPRNIPMETDGDVDEARMSHHFICV